MARVYELRSHNELHRLFTNPNSMVVLLFYTRAGGSVDMHRIRDHLEDMARSDRAAALAMAVRPIVFAANCISSNDDGILQEHYRVDSAPSVLMVIPERVVKRWSRLDETGIWTVAERHAMGN